MHRALVAARFPILLFPILLGAASTASAVPPPADDDACRREVDATIQTLEQHSKQSGVEERMRGLSANDIRALQKSDGNCGALAEINKRKVRHSW